MWAGASAALQTWHAPRTPARLTIYGWLTLAERARSGLGALYRRWPNKRALVLAALGSLTTHALPASTGDSAEDVLALVEEIATAVASPQARLMMTLLVGPDKELAEALRAANLAPQLEHLRERLRAALGDVDDLNARTELGPALISFRGLVLGRKVTLLELREDILPQLLRSS